MAVGSDDGRRAEDRGNLLAGCENRLDQMRGVNRLTAPASDGAPPPFWFSSTAWHFTQPSASAPNSLRPRSALAVLAAVLQSTLRNSCGTASLWPALSRRSASVARPELLGQCGSDGLDGLHPDRQWLVVSAAGCAEQEVVAARLEGEDDWRGGIDRATVVP